VCAHSSNPLCAQTPLLGRRGIGIPYISVLFICNSRSALLQDSSPLEGELQSAHNKPRMPLLKEGSLWRHSSSSNSFTGFETGAHINRRDPVENFFRFRS